MVALSLFWEPVSGASGAKGKWRKHQVYSGDSALTAVGGDFTGDGLPDVITNSSGRTRLLVAPDWNEIPLGPEEERDFIHSEVMDVDGDGDLDWIGARYQPGLITWLEQPENPESQEWKERLVDDQVNGIHGLLTGDVDQDGRLDLLATSARPKGPYPESLVWYRVPENPKQAGSWHRFVFAHRDAPGLSHYLGFGDVNGDGRPDAAAAAKGGAFRHDGPGKLVRLVGSPRRSRGGLETAPVGRLRARSHQHPSGRRQRRRPGRFRGLPGACPGCDLVRGAPLEDP